VAERRRAEELARQLAETDALTGCINRHSLPGAVRRLEDEARHRGEIVAFVMIDLDHFKQVNDWHGHLAGDRVLRSIAQVLKQTVRSTDLLMRWGGEEFVILLKNCDIASARLRGEQIRSQVERFRDDAVEPFTVSLGAASLKANESIDDLLARSDKALYDSKRNGRNRLTLSLD